ncbi:adenylyltransferase/cytidyltransferase family protein [Sulfitobacter sp. F26169L]|uniref:adenylyltransferase/cytidyltransferase family protein n=1 Tax=Sulfitobacter sp. F26169L TaxID=2996015 RepID=UPI0022608AAC|nr:adenylyltransferase/cytidyltransferase family protein [Sulfitobacter sp. F26169L]MCX7565397.1 adenylyltransferase/cytidyltransferase family protein [Sulfitobacter sp. F26169L]
MLPFQFVGGKCAAVPLNLCIRTGGGELRKGLSMISAMSSRVVLTYGSFDLFHQGHARLLQRLSMLGSELVVGCSTDAYNEKMGVPSVTSYADRRLMLESCRFVSRVIAEQEWDQKYTDIINYNVSVFAMGDDWKGQFDHFEDVTQVVYVPRAEIIGARTPFNAVPDSDLRLASGY